MATAETNVISLEKYRIRPPRKSIEPVENAIYRGIDFGCPVYLAWAGQFDESGVEWQYPSPEKDAYGCWLLDFLLPGIKMYVRIWDGNSKDFDEVGHDICKFVKVTSYKVLMIAGRPGYEEAMLVIHDGRRIKKRRCWWHQIAAQLHQDSMANQGR